MTNSALYVNYRGSGPSPEKDREAQPSPEEAAEPKKKRSLLIRIPLFFVRNVLRLVLLVVLLALPFFLLIRLAVFLHMAKGMGPWLSLLAGTGGTVVLLSLYVFLIAWKLRGSPKVPGLILKGVLVLVSGYALYGLVYLSAGNAKTEDVRAVYTALHPHMRLAASTLILFDRELLVTDAARTREDYERMGLPVNESSLHFEQSSGFVHAFDLRTVGREEWRNSAVEFYFKSMGFRTLRHVGTADHLHISLPVARTP